MSAAPSRTRAWFDLARAGNFPSVWSNVLAALVLSRAAGPAWPALATGLLAAAGGTLAYAGGATLNDVADAGFDAKHRPERAIPGGTLSRAGAAWLGGLELAAGAAIFLYLGSAVAAVLALVAFILGYDWLHKRWAGSVILMAGCRSALGVVIATLPGQAGTPAFWAWTSVLFVYIVTLSVLARREYRQGGEAARSGRRIGRLLAFIPLVDALVLASIGQWGPAVAVVFAIPLGQAAQRLAAST